MSWIVLLSLLLVVSSQSTFRQQHCDTTACNGVCVTNITMPCGQCIPCNPAASVMCVSAVVKCHTPENETIQEALYMTQNCSGDPYRTIKPDLYNPSASYCYKWQDFYVHNLCDATEDIDVDLSRFVPKLLKDEKEKFKSSESLVWTAIFEYKRFLIMKKHYPKMEIAPSPLVDEVWHMHILDTRQYMKDCERLFGFYMHHAPSFGNSKEEKKEMGDRYTKTLQVYESIFKESAPVNIWPRIGSADCGTCTTNSAEADCASCNTIACGTCTSCSAAAACFYPSCCA